MRLFAVALLCLAGCTASTSAIASPAPTAAATADDTADRVCAASTITSLVDSVNTLDAARLAELFRSSAFGLGGRSTSGPDETVAMLLERGRAGERWTLVSLQFSGRGFDGNVNFGVRLHRSGPGLPQPYADQFGKGSMDCPRGVISILYIG